MDTRKYLLALAALALTTLVATPLRHYLDLANIVMLFLLAVFLIALKLGRRPAIMAAFLAVASFDFFFVSPRLSFAVNDAQYLVTFGVMLAVGLATAHLTAVLQTQTGQALTREQDTQRLYLLARELAGSASIEQVALVLYRYMSDSPGHALLHLLDDNGDLPTLNNELPITSFALAAVRKNNRMDVSQLAEEGGRMVIFPLQASTLSQGVLIVSQPRSENVMDEQLLQAVADLLAIAIARVHYEEALQHTQLEATSERLRSGILSALSHDLRTPLAGLVGMADALVLAAGAQHARVRDSAAAIRDQALTMNSLLGNLLDMARLHAGRVELRKEWQLFEDVIGSAIKLLKPALDKHSIKVTLQPELPLVEFDAVLLERVLCNLLENAAKYSGEGQPIEMSGYVEGEYACITVRDHGRGFPAGQTYSVFNMFTRGKSESAQPGVGMGLAICRAIMEAHSGEIAAENTEDGAAVTLRLPLGDPPPVKLEQEVDHE